MARRILIALAVASVAGGAACGGKAARPMPQASFTVDLVSCPQARESAAGKIAHEAYLKEHADLTQSITVTLRDLPWAPPSCDGDPSEAARCAARDAALEERLALNAKEVSCVVQAFGPPGSVSKLAPHWYEPPRTRTNGAPVPIGTSFSTLAVWSQIEEVARHPYVARIEPAPGEAAKLGVAAPPIPEECPAADEAPVSKLADAASIEGQGRRPVVIELRADLMPPLAPCEDGSLCDAAIASGWARTIVARRMLTCVRRWIDSKLAAEAPEVPYGSADGIPTAPPLPPFGDLIHATLAFGLGLTWQEATEAARHPYVSRVWTSPALSFDTPPQGCPPNFDVPVQAPSCAVMSEASDGKFTAESRAEWEASQAPNEVIIGVRRPGNVCPLPECAGRGVACPERDRYLARFEEESAASQTCVRALVSSIGGTASAEVLSIANAFLATLTWPQIQMVAVHPHVMSISPRFDGTPPP